MASIPTTIPASSTTERTTVEMTIPSTTVATTSTVSLDALPIGETLPRLFLGKDKQLKRQY